MDGKVLSLFEMKKLVLFDMDGVLFDTMPRHARAWKMSMEELGIDVPESEFYYHEGRTGKGTIEIVVGPEADHVAIYKRKCEIFDTLPMGEPMPGARRVLQAVHDAGIKAVVVTGSGQAKTLARIEAEYPGLLYGPGMVSGKDVTKGKPDPEPYLMGLQKAGVNPEDAIVVENAPLGVRSAHDAGCFVVAVNTGPLPDSVLLDEGADILFRNMDELADHIAELL